MHVVFRVDSSTSIGVGHIKRCLALAKSLYRKGYDISFISRYFKGNIASEIEKQNFSVTVIDDLSTEEQPEKILNDWYADALKCIDLIKDKSPTWCVVDHYGLDARWHNLIRKHVKRLFIIDDLANRSYSGNILLDQTFGRKEYDYSNHVNSECKLLLGADYALLDERYQELRSEAEVKRENYQLINDILISFGGMDEDNITSLIIDTLEQYFQYEVPTINIVLHKNSPNINKIKEKIQNSKYKYNLLTNVTNMSDLMLKADLGIGAGGTTSWERCCLGLPALVVCTAKNQEQIIKNLDEYGAIIHLKKAGCSDFQSEIVTALDYLYLEKRNYKEMSCKAFNVCKGNGAEICSEIMMSLGV